MQSRHPTPNLDATILALADPTRRAILSRLSESPDATVGELAAPFAMSLPAVSKHLRVLERAGLIAKGRDAQKRPCHIEGRPLKDVAEWAERYRHIWERRLDRLDAYLHELQTSQRKPHKSHEQHEHKEKTHARKPRRKH